MCVYDNKNDLFKMIWKKNDLFLIFQMKILFLDQMSLNCVLKAM